MFLQHRRLSYSRHAVDDRDLSTQVSSHKAKAQARNLLLQIRVKNSIKNYNKIFSPLLQVNYKMQMNFRRMFNDRKHHKRSKRGASNKVRHLFKYISQGNLF